MTANQQRCELVRSARLQRGLMTIVEADTVLLQSSRAGRGRAAPDPHASGMTIVLIDRRPWPRQCLSRWFQQGSCNLRVVSAGSAAELIDMSEAVENLHLIVFSIGSASAREPEVLGQVTRLRQHMPQVPLVLLADRYDVDDIVEAMAHGVRGFIMTSMKLLETAVGIQCVAGGGAFVPANSLVRYAYSQRNGSRGGLGDAPRTKCSLSAGPGSSHSEEIARDGRAQARADDEPAGAEPALGARLRGRRAVLGRCSRGHRG
jgi:DNA-binding NarL/FixJ family response regulator